MARKPNHAYEKRQRELAKAAKKNAKAEKKRLAREAELDPDLVGLPEDGAAEPGDV